jgi:hypothetical protein
MSKQSPTISQPSSTMSKTSPVPLFLDPTLQTEFDNEGFVILPLLRAADVAHLLEFYHSQDRGSVSTPPFHYSMDHPDSDYVRRVMDELIKVVGAALQPAMYDCQVVTASFVVKEAHPRGIVPPHQDWTFVDETRFRSATVWVPLVDVDFDNGALGAIHGSHRFFPGQLRSSPSPQCKSVLSSRAQIRRRFKHTPSSASSLRDTAMMHSRNCSLRETIRTPRQSNGDLTCSRRFPHR